MLGFFFYKNKYIFGAMMKVSLINDGPTTIILDSKEII
ncbi:MAG TPA: D-aminoacyl-tRNA deacylase [Coprobacillaceae bacterium]|nr:D-aminoacyl-tRNA deacylase [Faecalibacillus intestinalis]HJI23249.1 D-aminoacyl-tRNA deacylase [Coprobacillaceae bacterium]